MRKLEGQVALITGGTSGLGLAVASRFLNEGAKVVVTGRSTETARKAKETLGEKALVITGDVSRLEDNKQAIKMAVETFGKIDILVPNAGVYDGNTPLIDIPEEQLSQAFDDLFGVNVKGYLLTIKAALPELLKTQGCIILSASYASFYAGGGGPLYTASKHAIAGLVKEIAFELAPKVRVNGVAPGVIATEMKMPSSIGKQVPSVIAGVEESLPLPMIPEGYDYTGLYVLLASKDEAKTMTGTIIQADCGMSIRGLTKVSGMR